MAQGMHSKLTHYCWANKPAGQVEAHVAADPVVGDVLAAAADGARVACDVLRVRLLIVQEEHLRLRGMSSGRGFTQHAHGFAVLAKSADERII